MAPCVTSRAFRRGAVWQRQRPGRGLGAELAFAAPMASRGPVVDDSLLAQRDVLRRMPAAVGATFPADRHHVVLVVKSHGIDDLVLTPRLTVRYASSSAAEVLARVGQRRVLATTESGVVRVDGRGQVVVTYKEPLFPPAAHSPDGALLALSDYDNVFVYRGFESNPVARLMHRDVHLVTVSADGRSLIAVGGGVWRRWDLDPRRLLPKACRILAPEREWRAFDGRYEALRTGR